jgi:RNA polymerase sigma factor (sigma-70 family)
MKQTVNELIISHLSLANSIAYKIRYKYKKFTIDELQSAAYMGLVEAANKYDEKNGVKFITFATSKIRWAILDYAVEVRFSNNTNLKFISLDDNQYSRKESGNREEIYKILTQDMNEREKEIFISYYVKEKKMHEIAVSYNVKESRISQILSKVVKRLQEKLQSRKEELYDIAA